MSNTYKIEDIYVSANVFFWLVILVRCLHLFEHSLVSRTLRFQSKQWLPWRYHLQDPYPGLTCCSKNIPAVIGTCKSIVTDRNSNSDGGGRTSIVCFCDFCEREFFVSSGILV